MNRSSSAEIALATTNTTQHAHLTSSQSHVPSRLWAQTAPEILVPCLLALGYYLGSQIGFWLTPEAHAIATYWPANAVVLSALLLAPPRRWWPLLTAVFVAHLTVQLPRGIPVPTALGWFVGNTAEAVLGAALLQWRHKRDFSFQSARALLDFLLFAVVLAPFLTSFLDAAVVVVTHWDRSYWLLWTNRLFSNMLASLTIPPAIFAVIGSARERTRSALAERGLEFLFLFVLVCIITLLVYGTYSPSTHAVPALVYAPLPLLLWACLRFGQGGLAVSAIAISVIAFRCVLAGRGPFASPHMLENVLLLQIMLTIVIVPLMLLNALLAERENTERELQKSRARLIHNQEEERRHIARELHDDIGQQLSLLSVEIQRIAESSPQMLGALESSFSDLRRQAEAASASARSLSHGLHPAHLEYLGLVAALRNVCAELQNQTGIRIVFESYEIPPELDPAASLALFRVSQEALNNIVKHSQAKNVQVQLRSQRDQLLLKIADDGIGFDAANTFGLGIINMKDRLESLRGRFEITAEPGRGTMIEGSVPLQPEQIRPARLESE